MNATTATPVAKPGTTVTTLPVAGPGTGATTSTPVGLPLPGAGAGTAPTADLPLLVVTRTSRQDGAVTVPLDAFAKRAGPDVAVAADNGIVRVHAVFQIDPSTKEMSVSVVDEAGRLVRMIPPDSVAKMIAAMAAYRGR
jgi:hypothetical protein